MATSISIENNGFENVQKQIQQFHPKLFLCSFDCENFLFTEYRPKELSCIILVNQYEKELYISNCSCGYYGHGPNNTERILKLFGFNEHEAEELKFHSTIKFAIEDGKANKTSIDTFGIFESRSEEVKNGQLCIDHKKCYVNYAAQRVYLFNSPTNSIDDTVKYLKLLKSCRAIVANYYLKNYEDPEVSFPIPEYIERGKNYYRKSVMHVQGNAFDVICFGEIYEIVALLNITSLCLTGKMAFDFCIKNNVINEIPNCEPTNTKTKLKNAICKMFGFTGKIHIYGEVATK